MFTKIKNCIRSNVTVQPVVYTTTHELAYAPLPCSPSSADWKTGESEEFLMPCWIWLGESLGLDQPQLAVQLELIGLGMIVREVYSKPEGKFSESIDPGLNQDKTLSPVNNSAAAHTSHICTCSTQAAFLLLLHILHI